MDAVLRDAYGRDVTTWDGFPVLRDIQEPRMTCYDAQQATDHPDLADEASLRVARRPRTGR